MEGGAESRRPERGAADGPPRSCRLLSTAPVPKGRPTKMTHNEPKEPTYDPFSSIPKSPPRQKSFPPRAPGGLPGGRGAQAPGAAQPPELQEVGRTSVTALQGSGAGVPGPRSGVEINTAPAARRRCPRCPAGPRGQPCCSASCRPCRPTAGPHSGQSEKSSGRCSATDSIRHSHKSLGPQRSRLGLFRQQGPERKSAEEVPGISRPSCPPWRQGALARGPLGGSQAACLLSVWCRKTSREETWEQTGSETRWEKNFFCKGCVGVFVCVRACVHFVRRVLSAAQLSEISRRGAQSLQGQLQQQDGDGSQGGQWSGSAGA